MADKWRRAWSINRSSSFIYVCATILISLSQVLSIIFSSTVFISLRRSLMKDRHYWPYIYTGEWQWWISSSLTGQFLYDKTSPLNIVLGRRGDEKSNAFYIHYYFPAMSHLILFLAVLSFNICRYFYIQKVRLLFLIDLSAVRAAENASRKWIVGLDVWWINSSSLIQQTRTAVSYSSF